MPELSLYRLNQNLGNVNNTIITTVNNVVNSRLCTVSGTTSESSGWFRIATSAVGIGTNSGIFQIDWSSDTESGRVIFIAGCNKDTVTKTAFNQLSYIKTGTNGIGQVRIVYDSDGTHGDKAYLEIYNMSNIVLTLNIKTLDSVGWVVATPTFTLNDPDLGYVAETFELTTGLSVQGAFEIFHPKDSSSNILNDYTIQQMNGTGIIIVDNELQVLINCYSHYENGYLANQYHPIDTGKACAIIKFSNTPQILIDATPNDPCVFNTYKLWHEGNDGAGSGLDADKFEGQEGTYYLNRANHTGSQSASSITQDTNNRFVTDAEKTTWNNKLSSIPIATQTTLGGVKAGTNINIETDGTISTTGDFVHPSGDGNLHVPVTSTTNNGKVLKAGATSGSIAWSTLSAVDVGLGNVTNENKNTMFTNPTFTGVVSAPTPLATSNDTTIATTAFVKGLGYVTSTTAPVVSVNSKTGIVTVTATDIGLGNVTNESKVTMFASPTFTGAPLAPTASADTNSTQIATTAYVKSQGYLPNTDYVRLPGFGAAEGSANAYTITLNPAPTSLVDGMCFAIKINADNTDASTINVNSLGAVPIVDIAGNVLTAGKLKNGIIYTLRYNATSGNFILQAEGGDVTEPSQDNSWNIPGDVWITNSSGNLSTSKDSIGGAGTQTAALCFGGGRGMSSMFNTTEKFNGSIWSTTATLSESKYGVGSAGTQGAALCFGGAMLSDPYYTIVTEKFNGTTWSISGTLVNDYAYPGGAGTQTAALCFGGFDIGGAENAVQKFNGTSWSSAGVLLASKAYMGSIGTQNAALCFGGNNYNNVDLNTTDAFNGTAWSTGPTLSATKSGMGSAGTQLFALCFGGANTAVAAFNVTEKFGGTSWSATGNLSVSKSYLTKCGTQAAALCFGGCINESAFTDVTEKFHSTTGMSNIENYIELNATANGEYPEGYYTKINIATAAANVWIITSGSNLNASKFAVGSAGTESATLCFGGTVSTYGDDFAYAINTTESFNGTSWSTTGNLSISKYFVGSAGTQSAGLCFCGYTSTELVFTSVTEKFNGSTWSTSGTYSTSVYGISGTGTQTAALSAGGWTSDTAITTNCRKFNGSTWSTTTAIDTAKAHMGLCGAQNSALGVGGQSTTTTISDRSQKFNGSTWTLVGTLDVSKIKMGVAGTQTAALCFGGYTSYSGPETDATEKFNGTTWSVIDNLNGSKCEMGNAGNFSAALCFGGTDWGNDPINVTERFYGI